MRLALKRRSFFGGTTWVAGLITAGVAAPILVILSYVGLDSGGLWPHLASTVLPKYVRNSLWLAIGVALLTCWIGVSTAWLVTLCRFPGRSWLRWALLLPFAIPSYLSAYAYTDLLQFSGPVQSALREAFDWGRQDYWFPDVRSLSGAIVILALAFYPYVYLAARAAFLEQSVCVLEVSRTLGHGPWRSFGRVALPLARPSIAAGLSLVLMETLAEFGAVQYCAVDTFATGIYRTFKLPDPHALTAAAQLSSCLLLLIALLVGLESIARRAARFHHTTSRYRSLPSWQLGRFQSVLAIAACSLPVLLGFFIPLLVFGIGAVRGGDARAAEVFWEYGSNTFLLASVASALAVLLALAVAFNRRLTATLATRAMTRVAGLGYAIPGTVIAIGVVITVTWLDRRLAATVESIFGSNPGLILSGIGFALLYGYQSRFLAVALNLLQAGFSRLQPTIDDAARTLGASPVRLLSAVHLPMLRGTLLAAGLLVFVDVVKELPATLILRPFNFETLAVRVYQLASDERLDEASTGALAIILIGLIPVLVMSKMLDRARPGTDEGEP